jgi:CubicO group peptidase (beta-lactamase class C family)
MKVFRIILPFTVIAGAALLVLYSPDIAPEKYSDLASFFRVERMRQGISGYAVAAVSNGRVLYIDGFGKDGAGNAITSDSRLIAPAVEKSFISLALLSLAQDRILSLDDPVRKYLPWFGFPDGSGGDVTIRHLISHSVGISDTAFDDFHEDAPDLETAAKAMTSVQPSAQPGVRFSYIDTGYQMLALVIESATGKTLSEVVDTRVFKVLGMKSTSIAPFDRLSRGNGTFFSSAVPRDARYPSYGPPSGWTVTTAADLSLYLAYILAPEKAKRGPVSLRTARSVFHPALGELPYGFGWFLKSGSEGSSAYHDGAVDGFSSRILLYPAEGSGIAVLSAQTSFLQNYIALPALTEGALRIMREGSTARPFPLGRLYILLLVVAAVHLIVLGAQTGGALGWARDIKCRTEAGGTRFPLRFAMARSWFGIAVRIAAAVFTPALLGAVFDRSIGWRTIFAFEPGAAAWCLSACFFGSMRNIARIVWLGRSGIPRAMN